MRARAEPFGAWVRLDDATLVAVNRRAARRLGIDGGALWNDAAPPAPPAPLEVHLAVTARCGAGCTGCYLDATPDGEAPPFSTIAARLDAVAAAGAFTVAFGGGEPLTRPDLGDLAAHARRLGLTPVVTTSGLGMTPARAEALRSFAQVNVSYDGEAAAYEAVRGFDGAGAAERAMRLLAEAGVRFGVNVVLTRRSFAALEATLARAASLGAVEAQLLRYKPAGRARSPTYLAARLTADQVRSLLPTLERLSRSTLAGALPLRIDCALVPLLSWPSLDGSPSLDPERLARFGVFGCEAARHLAAVRVDGASSPCSFAPEGASPEAWRAPMEDEPCRSCPVREVCRGGCRVVALHLTGELGPDPECPRVQSERMHREAGRRGGENEERRGEGGERGENEGG